MNPASSRRPVVPLISGGTLAMLLAVSLFVPAPRSDAEWGGVGGFAAANPAPSPNPVAGDTDGDGMPDAWETANLLNPANAADAASDFDRDGLTALQEYGLHSATEGANGKHLGTWSASWLPRPTGFISNPSVTIIECAPNGVILARVQGRLTGSSVTTSYPYTWSPVTAQWTRIAVPTGYESVTNLTSLTPLDVNASGQVVGYFSSGGMKGFLWTPSDTGGETMVYDLSSGGSQLAAIPKRISDTGYVVGNVGSLSGRSFAADESREEITFPDVGNNPVYHDVNDYGEFVGTVYNPFAGRNVTFLAVPGFPAYSTGIGGEALDEMAGVWGAIPDIDPAEIVWVEDPSGYGGFREGTATDQTTGAIVNVHEGYGASFYWYHDTGYYDSGWYSYPGFSQNFAAVNDWGEFAGLYSASMSSSTFYGGSQSSGQSVSDNGLFFFEGEYHATKTRPSIYGVSNDPRVLIGTPYALWSGSLVVPVTSLLPAGYPTSFAYARLADKGRVILQQSTTSQILVLKPNQDSDGDGMPNDWEVFYLLNPADAQDGAADANQNGISNRAEFALRANPLAAAGAGVQFIDLRPGIDTDGDGMPNTWEWKHGLNHSDASDAVADYDGDGLSNLKEFLMETNPRSGDTDHDSVADGDEVANGTDPRAKTDYDVDGIPDDFEKHFAKQFLAVNPDPVFWAGLHTGLLGGDLDPSVDYTGEGLSAGELPDLFEPALDPGPPASGYLVQPETRHNAWWWAYFRPGEGGTSTGSYATSRPYGYDLQTLVTNSEEFNSLYLSTRIGLLEWVPRTIPALVPWYSATDAEHWSKAVSVFLQDTAPGDPETTRYRGVIREQRFQVVATRADHEPLHENYLKVTLRRPPYGAAGATEILLVEPFDIEIPKGKFFSPWFEFKADMLDGKETIVSLLPVEVAPDVLAVNTNFDEGDTDDQTHQAVADCANGTLKAKRDHLDGKWKQDDIVTEDLHKGFFGIRPGTLPYTETTGAVVKIKKLDKQDPETNRKQSGHVRLYAVSGAKGSETEMKIELYDKDSFVANDLGPQLYHHPPSAPITFYLEGVEPGKITLEFSYQKGATSFKHEQEFLVATRKTRDQWRDEVRYQIRLQNSTFDPPNPHADINTIVPTRGFRHPLPRDDNSIRISRMYYYYAQLYVENPDKFLWPGMARVAASSIYAGMSDMYLWNGNFVTGGEAGAVAFMNDFLIPGAQAIFNDLAWAHRAYAASGIYAIKHLDETETGSVDLRAWEILDDGISENDMSKIRDAGGRLLDREQNVVIQPYYAAIGPVRFKPPGINHLGVVWLGGVEVTRDADGKCEIGEWMSANAVESPIIGPNPKPAGSIYGPLSFRSVVPGGRLDNKDHRWAWITHAEHGMLPRWCGTGTGAGNFTSAMRMAAVARILRESALDYSQTAGAGLPPW